MLKAIRITKENLPKISSETEVKKGTLDIIATARNCYLVVPQHKGEKTKTYHESLFREVFRFAGTELPNQFTDVIPL